MQRNNSCIRRAQSPASLSSTELPLQHNEMDTATLTQLLNAREVGLHLFHLPPQVKSLIQQRNVNVQPHFLFCPTSNHKQRHYRIPTESHFHSRPLVPLPSPEHSKVAQRDRIPHTAGHTFRETPTDASTRKHRLTNTNATTTSATINPSSVVLSTTTTTNDE